MSTEPLRLSEDRATVASLATRNGERTLIIDSGEAPRERPCVGYLLNDQRGNLETIRRIVLDHRIERIRAVLPVSNCLLLEPVCSVAGELGLELSVQLSFERPSSSSRAQAQPEVVFDLFRHPSNRLPGRIVKRCLDVLGASIALILLSPIMLAAAVLVKLTSPGPVFFRQPRVGRRFRVFRMFKFRTMVANAEALRRNVAQHNNAKGILFKVIDDPRLTRVGRALRRSSIDELPQLFNVLKGDMSLVGPRPIPTWAVDELADTRYHRRFSVLPGMTGMWQVRGRRQDFEFMATCDLDYITQWSPWLDLKVLAATPVAVLRGEGAS